MAYFYTTTATNNWSDATKWFNGSGGTGGSLGHAPTSSDDAIFDANSYNDNYTVTIDATANCADFTMDKPTGVGKKVTWEGTSALNIYGSLTLTGGTAGITNSYTGAINFRKVGGTATIDNNDVIQLSSYVFNGVGTTFQLLNDYTLNSGNRGLTLTNGTFDANGHSVIFSTGGAAYYIIGSFTFYNLTITPYAGKTDSLTMYNDITVTNLLTLNGNSATNRLLVTSNTIGTPRTITAASVSLSNVDFKDIAGAGAATWSGTSIGNCGGNSGITFDTATPQYWYKASGNDNWSTAGNWYLASGGTGGAGRVPLPQDTAIFDNASFGAAGMTLTQDMPRIPSTTFKGVDGLHPVGNNPTWTTSTTASIFGSLTLTANMTLTASTQQYTFEGRGNYYLESAGLTWAKRINIGSVGNNSYNFTFNDAFSSSDTLRIGDGINFYSNYNITCSDFQNNGSILYGYTLNFGSITITLTGTSGWSPLGVTSVIPGGSTIKFTNTSSTGITFSGQSKTYNNVWFARGSSTATNTINGSNTFNQFKDDGSAAHTLAIIAGTTQTIADWQVNGTAGNLITVTSTTTGTFNLVKSGGGKVSADYLDVAHSVASPLNVWYAGTHSTNSQATATAGSGWIFTAPPSPSTIVVNRGRSRFKFTPVSS